MTEIADTAEAIGWKRLAKGPLSGGRPGVYVILWHRSLGTMVKGEGPNYRLATVAGATKAVARSRELEAVKTDLAALLAGAGR